MEAIARVIDPACFNGKVPPEGHQPCSTGDRSAIQGLACVLEAMHSADEHRDKVASATATALMTCAHLQILPK